MSSQRRIGDPRLRRFLAGAAATALAQLLNAAGHLALVPLFLAAWDVEVYGVWLTVSAAVGYLMLLDMGLQSFIANRLHELRTRGAYEEASALLRSATKTVFAIFGVGILAVTVIRPFLPLEYWFYSAAARGVDLDMLLVLLAVHALATIPLGLMQGVYRSVGEFARGIMIANVQRLAHVVLSGVALTVSAGPEILAWTQLIPLLIVAVWAGRDLRKRHPEVRVAAHRTKISGTMRFLPASLLFLAVQGALAAGVQGSVLIIGAKLGPAAVAAWATARTLAHLVRQAAGCLLLPLWPETTALEAQERQDALRRIHLLATKLVLAACGAAGLVLHVIGPPLLETWTLGRVHTDIGLLDILLLGTLAQSTTSIGLTMLLSWNRVVIPALSCTIGTALGLGLAWALTPEYGMRGAALSILLAEVSCGLLIVPHAVCRHLGQSTLGWALEGVGRGLPVLATAGLISEGLLTVGGTSVATLPLRLIAVLLVVGGGTWALWLNAGERARLGRSLRRTLRSPKEAEQPLG